MKFIGKILKLIGILIFTVSILLFTASFFLQDRVGDIILESLNRNISTKLSVGSFRLSFLRRFPFASLELDDVFVHSSLEFNNTEFSGIKTDTLLSAKSISVEFRIGDIIKGTYNIEKIGAKGGKINLYSDSSGLVNYEISLENEAPTDDIFSIDLDKINLTDMQASYYNLATRLYIYGYIGSGRLKSRISGKDIDFSANASILIDSIQLYDTKINKTIDTDIEINLQSSESGIQFKKGIIQIENYNFSIDGNISDDNILDLNLTGNKLDLSKIRNYLPDKIQRKISEYDPSGILTVDCTIKGLMSRTSIPHMEMVYSLSSGHITYGLSDLSINDLSFSGYFSTGTLNLPETNFISIKDIKAKFGSSQYTGSFSLLNFNTPELEFILNGSLFPAEIKEFFALEKISTASGSVDLKLKLEGALEKKSRYDLSDIIKLDPDVSLDFKAFNLGFEGDKRLITQANGNILVSNLVKAKNLQFIYKGQRIKIDGEFKNLLQLLIGERVDLHASAVVYFDKLIPESFYTKIPQDEASAPQKAAFDLPGNLFLDITYWIGSLNYKSISASGIEGTFNYKPGLITFKTIQMQSFGGSISGNGFIIQDINKSVIGRANLTLTNIDVNNVFQTFNNFGQDFILSENLAGNLSGSLSVLLPMDSLLNPQIKQLTAEGKYNLTNGALKNFEPIKQLSNFIELSELENINFEKLENDFFIRDNSLYIPQMDVKSSAADLSINGKHSFDEDYEYHIKILLSELLSKKRKKNKGNNIEFGLVEDDGLGRTSMLLKIESKGGDFKVGYDLKAATNVVKDNIATERKTLRSILNEEYGWFKNDSTIIQKPAEKKPRFKISWDEKIDSSVVVADTAKKQGILKNLLKKK